MESTVVTIKRVKEKNKWVYSAHSKLSLRVEYHIKTTPFNVEELGKLVHDIADGLHGVRHYVDKGVVMLAVGNVTEYGLDFSETRRITNEEHARLKRSQVRSGDMLVTLTGRLGSALIYERDEPANLSAHVARVEVNPEKVNPSYLTAYLNSQVGQQLIDEFSIGSIYPHINVTRLKNVRVVLPPRTSQDKIANLMVKVYEEREKKIKSSVELLRSINSYVAEVLGINEGTSEDRKNFLVKRSQLHRFDVRYYSPIYTHFERLVKAGTYPTKSLAEVCDVITNGFTPSREAYSETGCTIVKVASITKNWDVAWEKVAFTSEELFNSMPKAHVNEGDVLLLSASHQANYIGKNFALVKHIPAEHVGRVMAVGELIIARPKQEVLMPEFLVACLSLRPLQELINRMTRGQSAHLYAEDLRYLNIPIPPIGIQQKVAGEFLRRRKEAKRLRAEAEDVINSAKSQVERAISREA